MSEKISPKPVKERNNIDLLELVCQLHSRSVMQTHNQDMHDAYIEARTELESRLTKSPVPDKVDGDKSVNQILFEHGIDTMSMNDDFNTQLFCAMERYAEAYLAKWQSTQQSDAVEETNELALEAMDFYWRALTDKLNGSYLGDIERRNYEVLTAQLYKIISNPAAWKSTQQSDAVELSECYFVPKKDITSATICENCGKEKMLHTIGEGIKASKVEIFKK